MPAFVEQELAVDKEITISVKMQEATDILAETLAQSEPFFQYRQANQSFNSDHQAKQLWEEYSKLQQKIRQEQYNDQISKMDLERLRELQNLIGESEIIESLGIAQESAIAFLREVNQEISQMLGFDFASFTQRPGNC
jgi:cell fate (sporulation/competence/biofilm development) regulator YlbF (YheA/YmcA/DUF963 family)